jgi:general secretion pathway protein J
MIGVAGIACHDLGVLPPPERGRVGVGVGEAGFTLVELLVALTLLSFVSLALFGALRFGIMAWARGTAHVERVEDVAFVQGFLRRLIADEYPMFLSNDPTRPHVDFEGTAGSLSFLAPAPIAIARGGRSRFALSVDRHHGRADLVIASRPELTARDDASTSIRKVLLAGVQTVEFSYFGRRRSDGVAQWRDAWVGELTMPALVRVQVRFAADDARLWPDLVLAPRIAVDVGCVYDTLTRRCRGR